MSLDWWSLTFVLASFFFYGYPRPVQGRRINAQSAFVNGTIWLDGGIELFENGTSRLAGGDFGSEEAPGSGKTITSIINVTVDFVVGPGPTWINEDKDPNVPNVASGFLWSNEIDTAWLFGGHSSDNSSLTNSIWRLKAEDGKRKWSKVSDPSLHTVRRFGGAGCNVASKSVGYYLGGKSEAAVRDERETTYLHTLVTFDMETEVVSEIDVPDWVPVVGQGLVYLETGDEGVLIAVGGQIEINHSSQFARFSTIYIYDIAAAIWTNQTVTSATGGSNEIDGSQILALAPGIGVPQPRINFCAVSSRALDKSSHSVFILGGTNGTFTTSDVFVLSLPSAVWIRLPIGSTTEFPKWGTSCTLLSSHYVVLYDGCYFESQKIPCRNYGYNPQLYDLWKGDWADGGIYHAPKAFVGLHVPPAILEVIGGHAELGLSQRKRPMFTEHNADYLEALFRPSIEAPPNYDWLKGARFNSMSGKTTVLTVCVSLICATIVVFIALHRTHQYCLKKLGKAGRDWRPWPLKLWFLSFMLLVTIGLIVTVAGLAKIGQTPMVLPFFWRGGLKEDGHWTGAQYNTLFTPRPKSGIPPQGLIYSYADEANEGGWSQRNTTRRFGAGPLFLWSYLPPIVTVLYGFLWTFVDTETKRVEKWRQLSRPGGCNGDNSLCQDYHTFWSPLGMAQGLYHRQWAVFFSSMGYALAVFVIPNVQNYVFVWEIFSGGDLPWGGQFSWQTALLDPYWSELLVAMLSLALACLLGLIVVTSVYETGMPHDIRGIGGYTELLLDQNPGNLGLSGEMHSQTLNGIFGALRLRRYRLRENQGLLSLEPMKMTSAAGIGRTGLPASSKPTWNQQNWLRSTFNHLRRLWLATTDHLDNQPLPFLLRALPLLTWIAVLVMLLSYTAYITHRISSPSSLSTQNFILPFPPQLCLITGVFVQSIHQVLEQNIRALAVFSDLRRRNCPPKTLWHTFAFGVPIVEIFEALRHGYALLAAVLTASLATVVYTISLGLLQTSSSAYGTMTFTSDRVCIGLVLGTNILLLAVTIAVAIWAWGNAAFLDRYPGTIAAILPYVINSSVLQDDLLVLKRQRVSGNVDKVRMLERKGRLYRFGKFERADGRVVVGIESNNVAGGISKVKGGRPSCI